MPMLNVPRGKIVNPGACCEKTYAYKQAGALVAPDGYHPATFGVLELPSTRFKIYRAIDGARVFGTSPDRGCIRLARVSPVHLRRSQNGATMVDMSIRLRIVLSALSVMFLVGCGAGGGVAGTSGAGGTTSAGGVVTTGGTVASGGAVGSGGIVGTGGTGGTGDWVEWPMPNSQVDVTAGAPNLESYTDNGDGTVTDNVTGLMWQQAVPATTYTWAQAVAYCPTLTLAGHSDWRLPSRIELYSIVDAGQSNPSINGTYFPSTPPNWFWSSSPVAGSPSLAWGVYFYYGDTYYGDITNTTNVRCVR